MQRRTFYIAFLGNVQYDSRCRNLIQSLKNHDYEVSAVSFEYRDASFKKVAGDISIYPLSKQISSAIFYAKFLSILLYSTFRIRAQYYLAADVYTLPVLAVFARLRKIPLYYDSREIYTQIAALSKKSHIQKVISWIEKTFIYSAKGVIVTGTMDGELLKKLYSIPKYILLRNLPLKQEIKTRINLRERFRISSEVLLMIYQGVVLHGRGLQLLYEAMLRVPNTALVVIGDGEQRVYYQELASEFGLENRVFFTGMISQEELLSHTSGGDIGTALIENVSLSYYYALPNKLFEYIMAGIPVLASNFPQMGEVVQSYRVGFTVDPENQEELIQILKKLVDERESLASFTPHLKKASEDLHWESDCSKFLESLEL